MSPCVDDPTYFRYLPACVWAGPGTGCLERLEAPETQVEQALCSDLLLDIPKVLSDLDHSVFL